MFELSRLFIYIIYIYYFSSLPKLSKFCHVVCSIVIAFISDEYIAKLNNGSCVWGRKKFVHGDVLRGSSTCVIILELTRNPHKSHPAKLKMDCDCEKTKISFSFKIKRICSFQVKSFVMFFCLLLCLSMYIEKYIFMKFMDVVYLHEFMDVATILSWL